MEEFFLAYSHSFSLPPFDFSSFPYTIPSNIFIYHFMSTTTILLIEDDVGILTPLSIYLEQSGFSIITCQNGLDAMDTFRKEKPHVIILDINLPGKNGVDICREIREVNNTPVIVLSARESEDDKVTLLELGADDYVAKPFSPRELVARIHAVIKRVDVKKEQKNSSKLLTLGKISIDTKGHIATLDGTELRLTKTEFALLEYFIRNSK